MDEARIEGGKSAVSRGPGRSCWCHVAAVSLLLVGVVQYFGLTWRPLPPAARATGDWGLALSPAARLRSLRVEPAYPSYVLGEPVLLVWTGSSDGQACSRFLLDHPEYIDLELTVVRPDGRTMVAAPGLEPGYRAVKVWDPRPHTVRWARAWMTYRPQTDEGREEPVFDQPGRYRIRATYTHLASRSLPDRARADTIASNWTEVEVVAPGAGDLAAYHKLQNGQLLWYTLVHLDDRDALFDRLAAVLAQHPRTAYTRDLQLALALLGHGYALDQDNFGRFAQGHSARLALLADGPSAWYHYALFSDFASEFCNRFHQRLMGLDTRVATDDHTRLGRVLCVTTRYLDLYPSSPLAAEMRDRLARNAARFKRKGIDVAALEAAAAADKSWQKGLLDWPEARSHGGGK